MSPTPDVLAIGGSAGAVEALHHLMPGLPAALAARVFVTVHIPATISALPAILTRVGRLAARHPIDGERTEPSIVYVAPPDLHLVVMRGAVRTVRGPRENGHRPAVDPMFRSAAAAHGARVIGVVLSGNLDDGAAGALAIHRAGGTVIVQDPAECLYPGMPSATLAAVPSAIVLPLRDIAPHIVAVLGTPPTEARAMPGRDAHPRRDPRAAADVDPVELGEPAIEQVARHGTATGLTCPECHGGVFEVDRTGTQQDRCRVGHAFTADVRFAEQCVSVEVALWTALRALEESAEMAQRLEGRARSRGGARAADMYARNAETYEQRASVLRALLRDAVPPLASSEDGPAARAIG